MAIEGEKYVVDDVNELFDFIRSNFKGSELSKIETALSYWDDGIVDHALDCFRFVSRNSKDDFDEEVIARMGMVACSTREGKTERALSSLGIILDIFRRGLFLENIFFLEALKRSEISSEEIDIAIEVFKKTIVIAEKFQIKSQKEGEDENKRVAEVTRVSARINLAKLQIFQEKWKEGLQNLLQVEALVVAKKDYFVLLGVYNLIVKAYYNLEGKNSANVQGYLKKHSVALNNIAQTRFPRGHYTK